MQDPRTDSSAASIPMGNDGRIIRRIRMSGIMRRKAATRTMPIPSFASEQHPTPPPPAPPPPPPPLLQDEDVPAAKRPRPEPIIISIDSDSDADADSDVISVRSFTKRTIRTEDTLTSAVDFASCTPHSMTAAAVPHQSMGDMGATTSRVPASECERLTKWMQHWSAVAPTMLGPTPTKESENESLTEWMEHWNTVAPTVLGPTPAKESENESLTEWMQYWNSTVAPTMLGLTPAKEKARRRITNITSTSGGAGSSTSNTDSDHNNINDLTTVAAPVQKESFILKKDSKLILVAKQLGRKDWVAIAALVPGRTHLQCHLRWIRFLDPTNDMANRSLAVERDAKLRAALPRNDLPWERWNVEEDAKLRAAVQKYEDKRWVEVAIDRKTSSRWTPEEDAELTSRAHGGDWRAVAPLVLGRNHNQCHQRLAHLNKMNDRAKEDVLLTIAVRTQLGIGMPSPPNFRWNERPMT